MLGIVAVKIENHGIDQFYGTVMSSAMVIAHHIGIYMAHQWIDNFMTAFQYDFCLNIFKSGIFYFWAWKNLNLKSTYQSEQQSTNSRASLEYRLSMCLSLREAFIWKKEIIQWYVIH